MKKLLIILSFTYVLSSCNNSSSPNPDSTSNKTYNKLEKASWLIGSWQNNSVEGNASEIWEKKNDSTYFGKSYFIIGKDTVSSETISLEQNGEQLFYIPIVKEQNGGKPVKFKMTSINNNQIIFENPKHDFPQKISYSLITNDSLLAEISGTMAGKQNSQKFPMKRVK